MKQKNRPSRARKSAPLRKSVSAGKSASAGKPAPQRKPQQAVSSGQTSGRRGHKKTGSSDLYLYGLHTVRSALNNPDRLKVRLLATENGLDRLGSDCVAAANIPVEICHGGNLGNMIGTEAVHQGVVLECAPLPSLDASELFHLADKKLVLALDQITDPHNVGAILRTAVAMGVDAVLVTSRNFATETGVLAKSASGALDLIPMVELRNFSSGLKELNEMGFITIGLDSEGPLILEDVMAQQVSGLDHRGNPARHNRQSRSDHPGSQAGPQICLVLGAEGKGLRQKSRETCTALARLDMPGPVKSLNVSNAAAVSLYIVSRTPN